MSDTPVSGHHSEAKEIMSYSFLRVFANDRTIDADELAFMEKLALKDGVVDEDEKRVLHNIFGRVRHEDLDPAVREEIARFKAKHAIE